MKTPDQKHADAVWWLGSRLVLASILVAAAFAVGAAIGGWLA